MEKVWKQDCSIQYDLPKRIVISKAIVIPALAAVTLVGNHSQNSDCKCFRI